MLRLVTLLLAASSFHRLHHVVSARNMNGLPGQYKIANGFLDNESKYSTDYTSDYFEVYSPVIKTLYSQVFWAGMAPIPLPAEIVERFHNKTMAVVGYEVDQVRVGDNGEEVPVPITHAYNHHYCAWLVNSKKAKLVKTEATRAMIKAGLTHGSKEHWSTEILRDNLGDNDKDNKDPLIQFFSEGNGGEMRLSYHGYPKGYAQLIRSPDQFHLAPMQIDTWNRDEPTAKFVPGPLPRNSRIPATAEFSGLVECPCSDRIVKQWNISYHLVINDNDLVGQGCDQPVKSQAECWDSVEQVTQASMFRRHVSLHNTSTPAGCSFIQHLDGTVDVYWNPDQSQNPIAVPVDAMIKQMMRRNSSEKASSLLRSRIRMEEMLMLNSDKVAFAAGTINITVAIRTSDADDAVVIMMVGPADRWFGVGFGAHSMCRHPDSDQCPDGGPYAIIVEGDSVQERQLGNHGPGTILPHDNSTWKVRRNDIVGGNRTVIVTRPRHGAAFSFDESSEQSLPIIMARGCSLQFAQHCGHGPADLQFLKPETTTQICRSGVTGTIQNRKFEQNGRCPSFPRSDLNEQQNPTCTIETYQGGLFCCNHGQFLLDHDQTIPWSDQYLEYQLKFRFYFEEYQPPFAVDRSVNGEDLKTVTTPPSHRNLIRLGWATEGSAGEHDIIQCRNGTAPSQCISVIQSRFQVREMVNDCDTHDDASWCSGSGSTNENLTAGIHLIYASAHCHAPSCLSMELYHANTGQLLCRVEPIYGDSDDGTGPYGTEKGYLALPPCLWGSPSEGLPSPVLLPLDAELLSIKHNNNTLPHTGEMALWQMRGVVVPK